MPAGWLSARGLALSGAWLGVLTYVITPGLVDEAVGDGLAWEMRLRALPARFTAYFTLGLCLFSGQSYGGVARQVTAGIEAVLAAAGWRVPSSTALSAARARLGEEPMRSLFRRLCSALSPGTAPWSHVGGLLAVAWDGTCLDVPGTPANAAAFGRHGATRGPQGKKTRPGPAAPPPGGPQLRLVALIACGTRALLDAAIGPVSGKGSGEQALASQLLASLRPGMLLLADRYYYSFRLWNAAAGTGCHLLWRVKAGTRLAIARQLPDGSWLAHVNDPRAVQHRLHKNAKRRRTGNLPPDTCPLPGITVRVIEYALAVTSDDGTTRTERYRLLTTLLDHRAFPAPALAAAYSRRWAIETSYLELKAFLRGPGRLLRGRSPALARQEAWALLAAYQAIRTLITRAAARNGTDPARISFTATLHAIRRTMPTPRSKLTATLNATDAEILTSLVPERPGRVYPRAVSKQSSHYPSRRNAKDPLSQHATYAITITPHGTPTHPPPHQPQQPETTLNQPP